MCKRITNGEGIVIFFHFVKKIEIFLLNFIFNYYRIDKYVEV